MMVIDGNNSLKRMITDTEREVADSRVFTESDRFLSHDFVNTFEGEVDAATERQRDREDEDMDQNKDGQHTKTTRGGDCSTNWKAAAADEKKRMWGRFVETGIFAGACRHGFVLWIADM